ncbi:MAG TPA: ComEC/Rec2 family competence protein [Planctomycetaceae bacterium]|nr:ComEC/Rec2 family competence protein [Planctomycetaceae bacterium]
MPTARSRSPALPVAACFAAGIALDDWFTAALAVWWAALAGSLVAGTVAFVCRREAVSAPLLLGGVLAAGGLAHHATAHVMEADDIALAATDDRRLVAVRGVVATAPEFRNGQSRSAWSQQGWSQCTLDCREALAGDETTRVSGRLRLRVSGALDQVTVGDRVEVMGWLSRPAPPRNPGEFDYREHLRRQGVRATLSAGEPAAVRIIGREDGWRLPRWLAGLRARCRTAIESQLSEGNRAVALARMLGDRSAIPDDVRESFVESGMMHVLAISGLHVGILALLLWCACRLLNLSPGITALVLVSGVLGYAVLAQVRPPIIRAVVFISLVTLGRPWHRRAGSANLLGLAALVVLVWRPTDLFDSGAQLSFLAVAAILFWHHVWGRRLAVRHAQVRVLSSNGPLWRRSAAGGWSWLKVSYGVTACIWLCTLPLIASQFNVVSAAGLALNVLLIPVVVLTLWTGYVFVAAALVLPIAAAPVGWAFDRLLTAFLAPVEWAATMDLGHRYVSGPPGWWLAGFYVALAVLMWDVRWRGIRRAAVHVLAVWLVVGLGAGLRPAQPAGLRCTFLSVGHGSAVLVELPGGKTLLYDAGSLNDARRAARAVRGCLWNRRRAGIDAIVVSHADVDHFNAVPELVESVPVGSVLAARSFLDLQQREVATTCDAVAAAGIALRLIARGDRLRLDDGATVTVLQPDFDERFSSDNASSVVLLIEFAGRRILLPGDLEDDGLDRLLSGPAIDVDVLLAPHHGSLNANTAELAAWAAAEHVVVSRGRFDGVPRLRAIYGDRAAVYATEDDGAVTFEISPEGGLTVTTMR